MVRCFMNNKFILILIVLFALPFFAFSDPVTIQGAVDLAKYDTKLTDDASPLYSKTKIASIIATCLPYGFATPTPAVTVKPVDPIVRVLTIITSKKFPPIHLLYTANSTYSGLILCDADMNTLSAAFFPGYLELSLFGRSKELPKITLSGLQAGRRLIYIYKIYKKTSLEQIFTGVLMNSNRTLGGDTEGMIFIKPDSIIIKMFTAKYGADDKTITEVNETNEIWLYSGDIFRLRTSKTRPDKKFKPSSPDSFHKQYLP